MKIRSLIFVCIIYFAASSLCIASGIGGSITPIGNLKVVTSVEDNVIFDKDIELEDNLTDFEYNDVNQIYTKISLGVTDYINLYIKSGVSNCGKIRQRLTDTSTTEIESDYGFLWGIGSNGAYSIGKDLYLGVDVQYGSWKADVDEVVESGKPTSRISGYIEHQEFQTALFIARKINLPEYEMNFTPYIGGIYNYFKSKTKEEIRYETTTTAYKLSWELEGKDCFGILVGTDISSTDTLMINVEARFFSETALTAAVGWKF